MIILTDGDGENGANNIYVDYELNSLANALGYTQFNLFPEYLV